MSVMSIYRRERRSSLASVAEHPVEATTEGVNQSLADLSRGSRGHIIGVSDDADPATARRLFDLGFAPGAEVEMLRRAPLADPVVFRVAGYDIALRRAQTRCIQISILP